MAAKKYFTGRIARETEKAIQAEYIYHVDALTLAEYTAKVWLPKSQIEVYHQYGDGTMVWALPAWLANKNHIGDTKKLTDSIIAEIEKKTA